MKRIAAILGMLTVSMVVLSVFAVIGMHRVTPADILAAPSTESVATVIFWQLRVPRVLAAFLAGMGLSVCGMAFQALFRNPLATPYTLGVSSGAALGAAVAIHAGFTAFLPGINPTTFAAFIGALLTIGLVYGLTRLRRGFSSATLLLAGIAVSFFFASLILLIQYMSDASQSYRMVRWMMGSVQNAGYADVRRLSLFVLVGLAIVGGQLRELNLLLLGEDIAGSRGVRIHRSRQYLFAAASLTVGAVVAVTGPIGFVGMMVPHFCRILVGADHERLMPLSAFAGGLFLAACDTLARTVLAPSEIPVGIVTALCGGPFFLTLLLRRGFR